MKQTEAPETSAARDSRGATHTSKALPLDVVDRSASEAHSSFKPGWPLRSYGLLAVIIMAAVAVGGVIGLYRQPPGLQWVMNTLGLEPGAGSSAPMAVPPANPSAAPTIPRANGVIALGRLVPASKIVTVAPASGVREARIAELKVSEGQKVARGEVLAVLDNEQRLASAVAAARSDCMQARSIRRASASPAGRTMAAGRAREKTIREVVRIRMGCLMEGCPPSCGRGVNLRARDLGTNRGKTQSSFPRRKQRLARLRRARPSARP